MVDVIAVVIVVGIAMLFFWARYGGGDGGDL